MFTRRVPFHQIAFATLLGVAGGLYVYRPVFEPREPAPAADGHLKPETPAARPETDSQPGAP